MSACGSSPTAGPRVLVCACVLALIYVNKLTQTTRECMLWTGYSSTRIKPSVESPKSGILVTEVITFDKIAPWVVLGRS